MRNKILFILFLLGLMHTAQAQYTGTYTATPNAAGVMKNIDFPTANHTGIVSTSIPLYKAVVNDFGLDLSLNYTARGIQVEEIASSVGLGWTLNAGGMITRAVRGEPDDFNKAWSMKYAEEDGRFPRIGRFWSKKAEKIKNLTPTSKDFLTIEAQLKDISLQPNVRGYSYHGKNDTEPDIFYFSCNGISGQFVFDVKDTGTQTIKLIPYQDVTITHTLDANGEIHSFTLKDLRGNTYFFNDRERLFRSEQRISPFWNNEYQDVQAHSNVTNTTYNSVWYLSKITTKTGEEITFTYANESFNQEDQVLHSMRPFSKYKLVDSSAGSNVTSTHKRITKITTPQEIISLDPYQEKRQDLGSTTTCYPIGTITAQSRLNATQLKKFVFSYDYFLSNPGTTKFTEKRLKLASLKESGVGTHSFVYNTTPLPDRLSYAQDFWGFYNGANSNSHMLPTIWYYPNEMIGSYRFSLYQDSRDILAWKYTGANRVPTHSCIQAGILTAILHPGGGKTAFNYEMNQYRFDEWTRFGAGLRIKSIKKYDHRQTTTPVLEQHYTYSVGKLISMPVFGYFKGVSSQKAQFTVFSKSLAQPGTTHGGFVGYENVTVREGSNANTYGRTEYRYNVPASFDISSGYTYYKAPQTYVSYLSDAGTNLYLDHITGLNVYPFAPHPNFDFYRGQVLSKKVYDSASVLKQETTYTYNYYFPGGATKPEIVYGLKFSTLSKFFDYPPIIAFVSRYEQPTQVACVLTSVTEKNYEDLKDAPLTKTTTFGYSQRHMNPIRIRRSGATSGEFLTTKYKYAEDYYAASVAATHPTGQLLRKRVNNLIETTEFVEKAGKEYLLSATLNDYAAGIYPTSTWTLPTNRPIPDFVPSADKGGSALTKDTRYRREKQYLRYDTYGNCMESKDRDGQTTVILWSYKGKYPVAVIRNATYTQVSDKLGSTFVNGLSAQTAPTATDFIKLRGLRSSLPQSEVTTYTYKDMVGVSEVNNPQGISTFYDYNSDTYPEKIYRKEKNAAGQDVNRLIKSFNYTYYSTQY